MLILGTNRFLGYLKQANQKLAILYNPKGDDMNTNKKELNDCKVIDLAPEAAMKALLPSDEFPCKQEDKACTKRWLESQSDCA